MVKTGFEKCKLQQKKYLSKPTNLAINCVYPIKIKKIQNICPPSVSNIQSENHQKSSLTGLLIQTIYNPLCSFQFPCPKCHVIYKFSVIYKFTNIINTHRLNFSSNISIMLCIISIKISFTLW